MDGVGGVGAVVAMDFDWIVIRRRGNGIVPMHHGSIVRRRRVIICKGRRRKFGAAWTLTEEATRLQPDHGC
jgi:hypothetical protein